MSKDKYTSQKYTKSNGGYCVYYIYSSNILCDTRDLRVCHMPITLKVVNWLPKSQFLSIHFETFEQTSLQLKEYALGKSTIFFYFLERKFRPVVCERKYLMH